MIRFSNNGNYVLLDAGEGNAFKFSSIVMYDRAGLSNRAGLKVIVSDDKEFLTVIFDIKSGDNQMTGMGVGWANGTVGNSDYSCRRRTGTIANYATEGRYIKIIFNVANNTPAALSEMKLYADVISKATEQAVTASVVEGSLFKVNGESKYREQTASGFIAELTSNSQATVNSLSLYLNGELKGTKELSTTATIDGGGIFVGVIVDNADITGDAISMTAE